MNIREKTIGFPERSLAILKPLPLGSGQSDPTERVVKLCPGWERRREMRRESAVGRRGSFLRPANIFLYTCYVKPPKRENTRMPLKAMSGLQESLGSASRLLSCHFKKRGLETQKGGGNGKIKRMRAGAPRYEVKGVGKDFVRRLRRMERGGGRTESKWKTDGRSSEYGVPRLLLSDISGILLKCRK